MVLDAGYYDPVVMREVFRYYKAAAAHDVL